MCSRVRQGCAAAAAGAALSRLATACRWSSRRPNTSLPQPFAQPRSNGRRARPLGTFVGRACGICGTPGGTPKAFSPGNGAEAPSHAGLLSLTQHCPRLCTAAGLWAGPGVRPFSKLRLQGCPPQYSVQLQMVLLPVRRTLLSGEQDSSTLAGDENMEDFFSRRLGMPFP